MIKNRGWWRRERRRYRREGWTRKQSGSRPKGREDERKHFRACYLLLWRLTVLETSQFKMAELFVPPLPNPLSQAHAECILYTIHHHNPASLWSSFFWLLWDAWSSHNRLREKWLKDWKPKKCKKEENASLTDAEEPIKKTSSRNAATNNYFHERLTSRLLSWLIDLVVWSENVAKRRKVMPLNVLFCPQPKYIQFTLKEE